MLILAASDPDRTLISGSGSATINPIFCLIYYEQGIYMFHSPSNLASSMQN
jgi:hypothetical protein